MATSTRFPAASSSAAKRRPRFGGLCLVASIALHGVAFAALAGTWSGVEASLGRRGPIDFELSLSLSELALPAVSGEQQGEVATPTASADGAQPEPQVSKLRELALPAEPPLDPFGASEATPPEPTEEIARATELADHAPETAVEPGEAADPLETAVALAPAAESGETAQSSEQAPTVPGSGAAATSEPALWLEGPDPAYPKLSVRYGEEGAVVCRLAIAADGSVRDVTVISSSGHARLDRAAVDALSRWRFRAAHEAGEPIPAELVHRVVFRLSGSR